MPYEKRVFPRIGDWEAANVRRVNSLKKLGLFMEKKIPVVDAMCRKGKEAIHTS